MNAIGWHLATFALLYGWVSVVVDAGRWMSARLRTLRGV
jgi:hypothetical protein